MRDFIRISLIGAECTGKSSAAQALSLALQERGYWAQYLPETLRLFCTRMGRLPKLPDEALIFETQLRAEHAAELAWQGSISRRADSSGPSGKASQ